MTNLDDIAALVTDDDVAEPGHALGYTRVAAGLRASIVAGELRPGAWLRLQVLAERFAVSVQPVREALQQLQGEGLVEIHPNRGAQVRGIDRRRLRHIYEIRGALESLMARQFADEASRRDIRDLEAIQAQHDAANDARDTVALMELNAAFHARINGHGGNVEAVGLIRRYYGLSSSIRRQFGGRERYWERVRSEHHALLDTFRSHDPAAAAEVGLRHVLGSLDDLLGEIDERDMGRSTLATPAA